MKNIYSLKKDKRFIKTVQEAALNTKKYGIASNHGLFGSEEWWRALENGDIEVKQLSGTISRVFMSGHNDFPEFEINSNSEITTWERKGNEKKYKEGSEVKLEYVLTKNRFNNSVSPTLINVWVN